MSKRTGPRDVQRKRKLARRRRDRYLRPDRVLAAMLAIQRQARAFSRAMQSMSVVIGLPSSPQPPAPSP